MSNTISITLELKIKISLLKISLKKESIRCKLCGHENTNYSIIKAAFETALKNIEINSVAPKLQTAVKTLRKHNRMIRNTFEYSNLTNGPLEGINTKIKLIQRISFGYRNFGNLRSRIILCTNLFAANPKKRSSNFMLLNLCVLAHQSYLTESQ